MEKKTSHYQFRNTTSPWTHRSSSVFSKKFLLVSFLSYPLSLSILICPADTNRVKQATATLRSDYYPLPESLTILLQLILSDQASPLRQLAATQARTLVSKHWKSLPVDQKSNVRQQLLGGILHEPEQLVRHAACRVITAIAKIDLENGDWPDFFDILLRAANNPSVQQREVGTYLLFTSLEVIGEALTHRFLDVLNTFNNTIRK